MTIELSTPIGKIYRIGPVFQKKIKKLGVKTVQDLLYHFPHRYEDFSDIRPISELKINETTCVLGKILEIKTTRTWKRKMLLTQALVQDKTSCLRAVWFNQSYLTRVLKPGDVVCLAGKVVLGDSGVYLANPAYEKISPYTLTPNAYNLKPNLTHTGRIVPVYPETEGLSSRWLRSIIRPLLAGLKNKLPEVLPPQIIRQYGFLAVRQAIWQVHFPDSLVLAKKARERFSFEELFLLELAVLKERLRLNQEKAAAVPLDIKLIKRFVKSLGFKLTDAQRKSAWQILKDIEKPRPMNRLLEGDVGSGKTVVALIAALEVVKAGYQVAFMAPTEILAKQHFQEVGLRFQDFKISIGLLTGKEDKFISPKLKREAIEISRTKLLERARDAKVDILIGTHALIQDKVKFGKLALVVLDEQHRFGVDQRARLCGAVARSGEAKARLCSTKSRIAAKTRPIPHLLSMTATPIPRSLALTIYGDLDLSIIDQLPKGRKKIMTKIVAPSERQGAYDFIRKEVKKGRQAFVICPRIEANDSKSKINWTRNELPAQGGLHQKSKILWAEVKAVKEEYEKLSKEVFPDLKVAMLHGKMASKEKERIMSAFGRTKSAFGRTKSAFGRTKSAFAKGYGGLKQDSKNKIDILVSTSVIEVGIDVPNAAVMMIEGAERFGLAQLHQFRGRVGRSRHQSFCLLFTESASQKTRQRLAALLSAENGFELSQKDLEIRGPGDLAGTRQWGIPDIIMAAFKDAALVEKTRQAAKELLEQDLELKNYPLLGERLRNFQERIHLE